jgi:hypothetical protein
MLEDEKERKAGKVQKIGFGGSHSNWSLLQRKHKIRCIANGSANRPLPLHSFLLYKEINGSKK